MSADSQTLYSQIPSVDTLLRDDTFQPLLKTYGTQLVTKTLRELQQQARDRIRAEQQLPAWCDNWELAVAHQLSASQKNALQQVFNLTGTVLHQSRPRTAG